MFLTALVLFLFFAPFAFLSITKFIFDHITIGHALLMFFSIFVVAISLGVMWGGLVLW